MPLIATRGAASVQGFGEFAQQTAVNYIEDVFSTYLYTGNSSSQTIVNGIDLAGKGGLVWTFARSNAQGSWLVDTARGATKQIPTWLTNPQDTEPTSINAFNSNGYSMGSKNDVNFSGYTYASWTFREQTKFFDIVTYTGDGTNRSITHNLGSTPGFVIVKRTDTNGDWYCGITAFGGSDYLVLNSTAARATSSTVWNNTPPTSTVFTVGTNAGVNASGGTYVAYLFANNAGGFGLLGTDSVISTTLVSSAGSGNTTVNLGFEPQFLLLKKTAAVSDWFIYDIMRGMSYSAGAATLTPNTSGAETVGITVSPTATGFTAALDNSFTYFCLAIRRGPMKVPTLGTSVYKSSLLAGNSSTQQITDLDFPPDLVMTKARNTSYGNRWTDRLRGFGYALRSDDVGAQLDNTTIGVNPFNMNGYTVLSGNPYNQSGFNYVNHAFRRAPSFFDEVCYAGTGSNTAQAHNLGVIPELVIVKARDSVNNWLVYNAIGGVGNTLRLQTAGGYIGGSPASSLTSTSVTYGYDANYLDSCSTSGTNYVAYLFATCAGVSKVGGYTGTGTLTTINCGFTGGARFVLIKRTNASSDWFVWDTARGMVSGTDPSLALNSVAAESNANSVYTATTGFQLLASPATDVNTSGGTYIFLAIA